MDNTTIVVKGTGPQMDWLATNDAQHVNELKGRGWRDAKPDDVQALRQYGKLNAIGDLFGLYGPAAQNAQGTLGGGVTAAERGATDKGVTTHAPSL